MNTIGIVQNNVADGITNQSNDSRVKVALKECMDSFGKPMGLMYVSISKPSNCNLTKVLKSFEKKHSKRYENDCLVRPVLIVNTPPKASFMKLALEMLKTLDDPLYIYHSRDTKEKLTDRIITLLHEQQVHLLIINEMQNYKCRPSLILKSNGDGWLTKIVITSRVPTAMVGGEHPRLLIIPDMQQIRHFEKMVGNSPRLALRSRPETHFTKDIYKIRDEIIKAVGY